MSAVLFGVACVLWVRSGRVFDSVEWGDGYFFSSLHGVVAIGRDQPAGYRGDGRRIRWETFPASQAWPNWPGFALVWGRGEFPCGAGRRY